MGTMTAVRHNPEMKLFFERLKANGKQTTQAQIAVMRKMITIVKIGIIRTVKRNMSGHCIGTHPDSISVDIRTLCAEVRYIRSA